jgi:hypothetical protein
LSLLVGNGSAVFFMQPVVRKTSAWAFSALFGCVSLLGQGWHCFVGHAFHPCAHDHAPHAHAACHDSRAAHGGHEHGGNPLGCDSAASDRPDAESIEQAAHDCPLCQFFAQAQWASHVPRCGSARLTGDLPGEGKPIIGAPQRGVYGCRGPPAGPHFC